MKSGSNLVEFCKAQKGLFADYHDHGHVLRFMSYSVSSENLSTLQSFSVCSCQVWLLGDYDRFYSE
jgi:hypothetical protein